MKLSWKALLYIGLTLISLILVGAQFAVYRNISLITNDLFFTISVLPLQVGLTALILDMLLERRVKLERLEKMNMVIGVFFSELGADLLRNISPGYAGIGAIHDRLMINNNWKPDDFSNSLKILAGQKYDVNLGIEGLLEIKGILSRHRSLLVQLLENPILLEHETFTNALRAIFHLTEELQHRKSFDGLPDSDLAHLNGDVARAYGLLISEWVSYMAYLKDNYPYLFSLATRTNPFDFAASPIIGAAPITPIPVSK